MGPEHIEEEEDTTPQERETPYHDDMPEASAASSPEIHVRSGSPDLENGRLPLPVWMRESSKSFHSRWVPYRIRQAARSIADWTKGPDPPQIQKITPFFPAIQEAPVRYIEKYLPRKRQKAALLAFFYIGWLLTFSLVLVRSNSASNIKGYGKPDPVWCGANFW